MTYVYTLLAALVALLLGAYLYLGRVEVKQTNIIFITADDLGFSDVGFKNKEIISPNINEIALNGVILNSSYLQPFCTPSRAAILTGRYPYKIGVQQPFAVFDNICLPLNETILPQRLKSVGYKTHAIGKWHLGYCHWACTPARRGFDTFYGIYAAYDDKYLHINYSPQQAEEGFDFRDDERLAKEVAGKYSTDLYGERAIKIIREHNSNSPLFMWLAFQNVHTPVTVPEKYIKMYPGMNERKAAYYGMVTIMDEYIGKIISTLKDRNMYDNTLIIFTTDNGATLAAAGASNWPLRGSKGTVWEGGTRGITLIAGTQAIEKKGYTHDGLFHAIDWVPTIMHFAERKDQSEQLWDGVDQYEMLYNGGQSKRRGFIYQLLPKHGIAIREGKYKLIVDRPGLEQEVFLEPLERGMKKYDVLTNASAGLENITESSTLLFNLEDDPGETIDLSSTFPEIVKSLQSKLEMAESDCRRIDFGYEPASDPSKHDGSWEPGWC